MRSRVVLEYALRASMADEDRLANSLCHKSQVSWMVRNRPLGLIERIAYILLIQCKTQPRRSSYLTPHIDHAVSLVQKAGRALCSAATVLGKFSNIAIIDRRIPQHSFSPP